MTRGYITIATGNKHYYYIAHNLLKTYRMFSKNPLPFAIICEEENDYTRDFDNAILVNDSKHSFMDKMSLFDYLPYDETIFIDADSLCFNDINVLFDLFKNETNFSAFGVNAQIDDKNNTWYEIEDIGEYREKIKYKCRMHAGIMFFRKSEALDKMNITCKEIINNLDKIEFRLFSKSVDECIFALAMPLNNMKTIKEPNQVFGYFPCLDYIKANYYNKVIEYKPHWTSEVSKNGRIIHFGTYHTKGPLYTFLIDSFNNMGKDNFLNRILYKYKLKYYFQSIKFHIYRLFKRIRKKILNTKEDI